MEQNTSIHSSMLPESQDNTPAVTQEMIMNFKYFDREIKRMLVEKPSIIGRFLDKAKYNMVNDLQRDIIETNGKNYVAACKAVSQFQLKALEEEFNDRLKRGVVSIRSQTIKIAASKLNEVKADLTASQHQFLALVESNIERCSKVKNDFLRDIYMESIKKDTIEVFKLFERLSTYFASFVDTTIGGASISNT